MSDVRLIRQFVASALLRERNQAARARLAFAEPLAPPRSPDGPASGVRRKPFALPPTGVWLRWSKGNPRAYRDGGRDTGPGEEMLAWELHGSTQGNSVPWDIVDADGNKWEVKEPDTSNAIRPGIEGRKALAPVRQALEEVCRQLSDGFDIVDFEALEDYAQGAPLDTSEVAAFISEDVPMIMSGEISAGRIMGGSRANPIGLLQVLEFVKFMIGDAAKACPREVKWGNVTRIVDIGTYVHASRALGLDDKEIDATVCELFAGTFRHPAFRKPNTFIKEVWHNGVKASAVFGHTAGVIIVDQKQYMIIPRDELDVHFKFQRISKGEPRFVVVD
jgi:hypothetical protein